MPVPRRILVLGPSGAGKSTLARRIGARLDLPVVHLDTFHWNPGWIESEVGRFRQRLAAAVAGDAWVMDGNYTLAPGTCAWWDAATQSRGRDQ